MTGLERSLVVLALASGLALISSARTHAADDLPPPPAAAAARLSPERVSAAVDAQAMLTVESPGRFAITADSPSGVALQLIDMLAGPGELFGQAGVQNGRIDALLDKGTYKIRTFGAEKATGDARLSVKPFREAGPVSAALLRGGEASSDLADLTQRSYWILVDTSGALYFEAAGRALADLRLWRNGTDLVELDAAMTTIEPKSGHPLLRARLDGKVEPGLYLATVYGGEALAWADGDKAQPLHVRAGAAPVIVGSTLDGVIGPFGDLRFRLPEAPPTKGPPQLGVYQPLVQAPPTQLRLELAEPAPVRVSARRGNIGAASAAIARNSREPVASLNVPGNSAEPGRVEVAGAEGQVFRLRVLKPTATFRPAASGKHLVALEVAGEGGDELPTSVVMAAFNQKNEASSVVSTAPRVGPGQAWRRKFNLRGTTEILFEVTGAGPLALRTNGPAVTVALEYLRGGRAQGRADGWFPETFEVEPGWYRLRLAPSRDSAGILDVTIGPPGLQLDIAPPAPRRTAIPLGIFDLDTAERYQAYTDSFPGLTTGLVVRPLPLDLAGAPVAVAQGAEALEIPVRIPRGGAIAATDTNGRAVAITSSNEAAAPDGRTVTVRIPPAERPREIVLSWSSGAPPDPVTRIVPEKLEVLSAAKPRFFDLKQGQEREFLIDLRDGGLYHVETLGRLKTSATVATSFLPKLATAADNGPGHNALLQTYLRAGQYRVRVSAADSAGRLGLIAAPAPLIAAGPLAIDGSARASLAEGRGALFTIDVAETGTYRLDLYGLGHNPTVRLEDSEGWPLTVPGELARLEQRLAAGSYRLVALPQPVDARVVARLKRIADPPQLSGHGPHPLAFDTVQKFQWREPAAKDAERVPDRWQFTLEGDANVTLDISDGMVADLRKLDGGARSVAKAVYLRGFSGRLTAGRYSVEARALGRNDRLDYELTLRSTEVQPGTPRFVDLPATIPFAIAQDRVVSLTTFGRSQLAGVLKNEKGEVIERLGPRQNDWNIALSRRLAAGAYRLELAKVAAEITPAQEGEERATPSEEQPEDSEGAPDESAGAKVEIRFALPDDAQVCEIALPSAAAGELMLVAAESRSELALSLEREQLDRTWRTIGLERGVRPVVAAIADGGAGRRWRALVWRIDGGTAPIATAAQAVSAPAQALGPVTLAPINLAGISRPVRIAQVTAPSGALVSLAGSSTELRQGSAPGRALGTSADGLLAPQSERLWLLDQGEATRSPTLLAIAAAPGEVALSLATDERAVVKSGAVVAGRLRAWRADSMIGQPGLAAGGATGIAESSAFAVGTSDTATIGTAAAAEPLQANLVSADVTPRPSIAIETQYSVVLPPRTAQPLTLSAPGRQIELGLAAGAAAVLGASSARPVTVWTGRAPVSREVAGNFADLLLVNPGDAPLPVSVTVAPASHDGRLATGQALKRFFGAAGSLSLALDAAAGDRLTVAGARATFVDEHGTVQRGTSLTLSGPGELTLDHPVGLVAAWIERDGKSPWPAAPAVALKAPQRVTLTGDAMTFALKQDTPVLLRVRTTAPVILALDVEHGGEPLPFPAGADFYRYVPAGEARLRLYSPHDGPLAGSLELTATPVIAVAEGLGEERPLAPGATALFGFELTRATDIGVGVRSEPDRAVVRLLDASGRSLGDGVAQLHRLAPGRYLVEARVPADGGPVIVRPALIGITPRPAGPPPDVARQYLEMVGLTPNRPARSR